MTTKQKKMIINPFMSISPQFCATGLFECTLVCANSKRTHAHAHRHIQGLPIEGPRSE